MNRKIIIGIVTALLIGVVGFVGYTAYQNNKESNVSQDENVDVTENNPVTDEDLTKKDENSSSYTEESVAQMDDEEKEAAMAVSTFMDGMNATFNVSDTTNEAQLEEMNKCKDKYFTGLGTNLVNNAIKYVQDNNRKVLKIENLNIKSVKHYKMPLKDKTGTIDGFLIYYQAYIKADDKIILGADEEDYLIGFVAKYNGEYKIFAVNKD